MTNPELSLGVGLSALAGSILTRRDARTRCTHRTRDSVAQTVCRNSKARADNREDQRILGRRGARLILHHTKESSHVAHPFTQTLAPRAREFPKLRKVRGSGVAPHPAGRLEPS